MPSSLFFSLSGTGNSSQSDSQEKFSMPRASFPLSPRERPLDHSRHGLKNITYSAKFSRQVQGSILFPRLNADCHGFQSMHTYSLVLIVPQPHSQNSIFFYPTPPSSVMSNKSAGPVPWKPSPFLPLPISTTVKSTVHTFGPHRRRHHHHFLSPVSNRGTHHQMA